MRNLVLMLLASTAMTTVALAQTATTPTDIGTVNVQKPTTAAGKTPVKKVVLAKKKTATPVKPVETVVAPVTTTPAAAPGIALSSDAAIGSGAPIGSAPALAPSQASLNATEPGSTVSDKVLRDVVQPSSDYNEALKFTPGFVYSNPNGNLGDAKSSFRGLADGQFNIDYDGIPFGDENDPTHHSAAYFPGTFIGSETIDRGPGEAHTIGYAPFGGDIALHSRDLTDKAHTEITGSIGTYGTYTGSISQQTGLINGDTRALFQYNYAVTDGAIQNAHVDQQSILGKLEKKLNDNWTLTLFGTITKENYNNTQNPTYAQLQRFGSSYAGLNNDPTTQEYIGFNNSKKQTDMEYLGLKGREFGWQFENKVYTYSYFYPDLQNNGNDQTIIDSAGTISKVSITNPPASCLAASAAVGCKTTVTFTGQGANDVTGYKKYNNYRAWGDSFTAKKDIEAGIASGQLRTGIWAEIGDNTRYQQYYDYTQGKYYTALNPAITAGGTTTAQNNIDLFASTYKLQIDSRIKNYQPWIEYEWKPTSNLSITPGFKYESFERNHQADVNQTTLQPANFDTTYTTSLPYLDVRYKVNPDFTVYAQASQGFLAPTVSAYYVFDDAFASNSLSPETTTNLQAGAVYKSKNLTASADIYQITAKNFPVVTTSTGGLTTYANGGTAVYKGVEGEATYAFGNGLAVYGSGSVGNAQFTEGPNTGNAVPNAPTYTAAGGLVYDKGQFFGSVLHKITGEQYGSSGQVTSTTAINGDLNKIGSYQSTDLVAGIREQASKEQGGQTYEFKVGVTNVFNNTNIVDIGGKPAGLVASDAADSGLTYVTQAGRSFYAGVKVGF